MDTLQCAIVLAKLGLFDWELAQRRRAAATYDALLGGKVDLVARKADRTSVFAQYTVLVEHRNDVQRALQDAGIPTAVHYPVPIHMQPAYAHLAGGATCPVARSLADRVMSLPMGPYLRDEDIQRVCAALLEAVGMAADAPSPGFATPAVSV
jgi:UDP-2-acetamido-2-deoxy-ribo-hexuluronate aminotransferase